MNYTEAKELKAKAENAERQAAAVLQQARGTQAGPMGLTPDHVKASPEFQAAYASHAAAFRHMQTVNSWFCKAFKKEYAAERKARLTNGQQPMIH
jgi:hypothetical protein